jgi:LuxR family maltose regulon positive regulatory protein
VSTPVLATKLYVPPPRPGAVLRRRLTEQLNAGLAAGRRLILVSASAGFGKTTLVSEWLANCGRPAAWLSLDEGDSDPVCFLTHLCASAQTLVLTNKDGTPAHIGAGALGALQSPQPPPIASVLTTLLNEIALVAGDFVLVLDDYHRVDSKAVDGALAFLLEHQPPQMRLLITTREDPQLPLARLRARGQLTELRAADLRFSATEASEFLTQAMGLRLPAGDIAALETRTEGWITGLQLAGLALQGSLSRPGATDTSRFIQAFTGSNRFVLDYLVEEVLQRQPEPIRSFLLQTALLERLCGPLCDAVTETSGGTAMLDILERANLFIVPLDNQRQWYRYHHLFAEVLLAFAEKELPGRILLLRGRASVWCAQNDLPADAIQYALAARDFERAAELIEKGYTAMDANLQSVTWLGWAKKLPAEIVRQRPVLCVDYAWALSDSGEPEASASWLRAAEQRLEGPAAEMRVADAAKFRALPARIALVHATQAQVAGDVEATATYAALALERSPDADAHHHALATVTLGMANWSRGDLAGAERALTVWINYCLRAGKVAYAIVTGEFLAGIIAAQGRLRDAEKIYGQAIALAMAHDPAARHVAAGPYLGLGLLHFERGEGPPSDACFAKAVEMGEQSLPDWPCRWRLAQARLRMSKGDLRAALELLEEAQHLYIKTASPDFQPIAALKARVHLRQGRLPEVLAWARARDLSVDDDLSYVAEFEHVTLARALIAQHKDDPRTGSIVPAIGLLDRLLLAAEAVGRMGSVIEIGVMRALALQAQGDGAQALAALERALALAAPEGYVRIFVDEGAPMAALLSDAAARGGMADYARNLLAAFQAPAPVGAGEPDRPRAQALIEPLSPRELEVLQLIAQGCSNRDIGERLFLAVNTVKGYNQKLFDKLQVQSRTEAIARARALGLL